MIKKEFIDKCAKFCKKEKAAEVLHAESVRKINDKTKGNKKRVLVITNQFITYFKEQKQVKPDHLHYWRNVSSFDINDQTVIIKFEKDTQLRFIHPNIEEVQSILIQLFLRTFSSEELGPLDLSHFPHPPIGVNARGIISRFDTLFRMDDKDPNVPARKFFQEFLLRKSKYVRFDENLEIDDVLPLLLEALRPLPYIQYLSIPKIKESNLLYEALTQFVSKNSELKMLALHNNLDDNSSGFVDALRESPVSQLKGLTFEDIEFTESELTKVRDLSIERHLTSASFINSIPESLLGIFNTSYLSNELMAKLRYLSLDRTVGINLKKIGKRINALSVLSLANCELDIADVLETFEEAQLENLRFLNLSGNKMSRSTSAQIPKYLERLHVSNVSWSEGVFPQFLQYFLSQTFNSSLKFNCSSAQEVTEDDWDEVSNTFSSLDKYPLEEFSWSNNKVSKSLITYLTKNRKLSTLFLSNCFDVDQEPEIYQTFCEKLPEIQSLSHLVIVGSDGTELRDQITDLLEALKQAKSLNLLILDGNKIKDDGIEGIKELISSNNSVHTVSFDSSYMTSSDPFRDLIEAGRARRRPLHISWPLHDINRLFEANSIGKDELQILKRDVTLLSTGRGNVVSDSQWLQAFNIQQQQTQTAASQRNVKIGRGSVRIKNNQVAPTPEPKKEQGRKVRAGSFRGLKRPSLLTTEKSPTEEDPNLWINEPFEVFFVDFNDEFPLFITDDINDYFEKYPIGSEESTDGKKHKHHSSKHHSSKHHHSKHHSSKHHSSKHHSSKHHHHHKNDNDNEEENKNEIEDEAKNDDEVVNAVQTREIKIDNDDDNDNNNNENENIDQIENDDDDNEIDEQEENRRRKRDKEMREKLEKEEQEELKIEKERINRQKDRETREKLEKEQKDELEIENKRREREIKQKEKERIDREMAEKREREKEVNDKRKRTREVFSPSEKRSPRQLKLTPELEKLNSLFESIEELEPIVPPKNMFLYIDPYGRPVNEPIQFTDGSNLSEYNPDPIDLINMAPPKISEYLSTSKKPKIVRNWPSPENIDRSSLEQNNGELNRINIDELLFEDLPDFDDDDIDDDDDLEKVDNIVLHKREREDNGAFNIPQKRFPVFPLLNVQDNENSVDTALPIDWNFQFSQVSKIGNYRFNKQADKPLENLIDDLNQNIQKDQIE